MLTELQYSLYVVQCYGTAAIRNFIIDSSIINIKFCVYSLSLQPSGPDETLVVNTII